ncbi:hypothetical protein BJ546DRAFT_1057082 [Cryomyces antarcticus]
MSATSSPPARTPRKQPITNLYKAAMNRFLTRKKLKEDAPSERRPSEDYQPSLLSQSAWRDPKRWKKNKKVQQEQKVEVNILGALPSTDNFRTSLMMPNLSARFSMLREQDDPNSKLGKASDDSVLQPKRQSRLMDFGFTVGGLSDIAERSSVTSSIRPPFAYGRQDSYVSDDGDGTDNDSSQNGSLMSRARPGEGNVLFGGRQKVYRIPVGPPRGSGPGNEERSMGGRALFVDDVSTSAFQKLRQQEREKRRELENRSVPDLDTEHENASGTFDLAPSPSDHEEKRKTSSSTTSDTCSSTPATSIASQGANAVPSSPPPDSVPALPTLDRSATKSRRLYDRALDQHMHDQQASALTRLNSIQQQRALPNGKPIPPYLTHAKSAGNLDDRFDRPGSPAFRSQSPPPSTSTHLVTTFGSTRHPKPSTTSPMSNDPQSPLSPTPSEHDEASPLTNAIEPGDRGKATALGAFNKPKQQFDEQQYLQRQMQMHRGKALPTPPIASPSNVDETLEVAASGKDRERNARDASRRSRPRTASSSQRKSLDGFPFRASGADQIRPGTAKSHEKVPRPDPHGTFFGNISASDSEDGDEPIPTAASQSSSVIRNVAFGSNLPNRSLLPHRPLPPILQHPAMRSAGSQKSGVDESVRSAEPSTPTVTDTTASRHASVATTIKSERLDLDSPTLGPTGGGLSGLVHQHLRNTSTQSSIYGPQRISMGPVPDVPALPTLRTQYGVSNSTPNERDSDTREHSSCTSSNPWDLEDFDGSYYYGENDSISSVSPVDPTRSRGQPLSSTTPKTSVDSIPRDHEPVDGTAWQHELRKQHTRVASTATQQEREAFDNELAQRKQAIQENLRSMAESESRAPSPGPAMLKVLDVLRAKSSRDSISRNQELPTKAMKMLGATAATITNARTPPLTNSGRATDHWRQDEERRPQEYSRRPTLPDGQSRVLQQSEQDARREREQQRQRHRGESEESSRDNPRSKGRSTPSSTASRSRTRSSSEASNGRSRSRTGRYRDDLEKAMIEGTGSSGAVHSDPSPMIPQQFANVPRGSPDIPQSQIPPMENYTYGQASRLRNNSKSPGPSYFDSKSLHPLQTSYGPVTGRMASGSTSPNGLLPAAHSPASGITPRSSPGVSPITHGMGPPPRPTPGMSPYATNTTPPLSTETTPATSSYVGHALEQAQTHLNTTSLRKKSIQKSDISEPTLISTTSNVDTFDLPPGTSLRNGQADAPVAPAVTAANPRRRRTHKLFNSAFGRSDPEEDASSPLPESLPEQSSFSADDDDDARPRLRKSSSEGRNMSARVRQQAAKFSNSAMPPHANNTQLPQKYATSFSINQY